MKVTVWLAIIMNRHGDHVHVCTSREAAIKAVADYCRDKRPELDEDENRPDLDIIKAFYGDENEPGVGGEDEGAEWESHDLELEPPAISEDYERVAKAAAFFDHIQGARAAGKDWWADAMERMLSEQIAKDKLIARMLAALTEALPAVEDDVSQYGGNPDDDETVKLIRDAIAAAGR